MVLLRRSSVVLQHFRRSSTLYSSSSHYSNNNNSSRTTAAASSSIPAEKLELLLQRCGLHSIIDAHGGSDNFARIVHSHTEYQLFAPLFTPYFTISHHQLTMLGDTIMDDFLTRAIMDYAIHMGLVLTVNATRQLKAVLHNHFTLRLFAKELHFDELVVPLEFYTSTHNNNNNNHHHHNKEKEK
ncbi:uncharacterized protein TM35_000061180, partial [Trypanosoma theileri]